MICLPWKLQNSPASEFYKPTFRNTLFHLHRQVGVELLGWKNVRILHPNPPLLCHSPPYWLRLFLSQIFPVWIPQHFSNLVILPLPAYKYEIECSETSEYNIQTPGNCPKESTKHSKQGESLKSLMYYKCQILMVVKVSCFGSKFNDWRRKQEVLPKYW
jgi:hypothetical protein